MVLLIIAAPILAAICEKYGVIITPTCADDHDVRQVTVHVQCLGIVVDGLLLNLADGRPVWRRR